MSWIPLIGEGLKLLDGLGGGGSNDSAPAPAAAPTGPTRDYAAEERMQQEKQKHESLMEERRAEREQKAREFEAKQQAEREKAQLERQKAEQAHDERMDASKKAHEITIQKEEAAAKIRQTELQNAAKIRMEELANAAKDKEAARKKEMQEMKHQEDKRKREHEAREAKRQKEHEVNLEKLEQEKLEIKRKIEAQEQKHQEDLKQMWIDAKEKDRVNKEKQRDDALMRVKGVIDDLENQKNKIQQNLVKVKKEHEDITQSLKMQDEKIENFNKEYKLKTEKEDMDKVHAEWKRNDDEILAAIDKTCVHESNIAKFLRLTEGLIKETVASEAQANKLDAELSTFSELISSECQDKLEIDTWFRQKSLLRFIPIMRKENFIECQDLVCSNDEEFEEDILSVCQNAIAKQIKEWKKKNPNAALDPFDAFLEHYKLMKYKNALRKGGLGSLDDIDEDLEDEAIDELISEAKIKALHKKRVKKAIKDVQTGTYEVKEDGKENDNDEEEKETEMRPKEISTKEERELRLICVHPENWKEFEQKKALSTKLALLEMTPLLGKFFSKMHLVIKEAQKLLHYGESLNEEQEKAYSALDRVNPKAIEAPSDDSKIEDPSKLPDYDQRESWQNGTPVQIYSKSQQRWYNGTIIKIDDNDKREIEVKYDLGSHQRTKEVDRYGTDVRDPIMTECTAIQAAIEVDINVVDIMQVEFEVSPITRRGLIVAQGVEESAKAILLCQSRIRQAMRLAGAVLRLKPANLSDNAKPLWDAVSDGITHIIKTALEMSKISAQFFGFFLKFNQSLQRFISMNHQDEDTPLVLSLELLKKNIRQFSKFKDGFNVKLQALSKDAMRVIENCVKEHIGIETFNKAKIEREKSHKEYLEKKAIYDRKSLILDNELEALCVTRAKDRGLQAKYSIEIELMKKMMEQNQKDIDLFSAQKRKLNALNFDAFQNEDDKKANNDEEENDDDKKANDDGNNANNDKEENRDGDKANNDDEGGNVNNNAKTKPKPPRKGKK